MSTKKSTEKVKDSRTRNFTAILYPDSENTPANWKDVLSEWQVPLFISPIHDHDVNLTGEQKKPHYHIILMFDSTKTIEQAKEVFSSVGAVPPPGDRIKVSSIRGAARYLCHLDNPDKFLYDTKDVVSLFGADYISAISLVTDKYAVVSEMITYCKENDIYSFSDLLEYSMLEHYDWFRTLCDNGAVVMEKYLKSRLWTNDMKRLKSTKEMLDNSEK